MQEPTNQNEALENTITEIEKEMMHINPDTSEEGRRLYLAGRLNLMLEESLISEEIYEQVYPVYCF